MQVFYSYLLLTLFICVNLEGQTSERFINKIFKSYEIDITQDVVYGSNVNIAGDTVLLKFDFYAPNTNLDTLDERPLIIWAHGGSFIARDENHWKIESLAKSFARKGYACASISYRMLEITDLSKENYLDEVVKAVGDMKSAIRYFRKDAATKSMYKIDPSQIFVGGSSAGGLMALHTAYMTDTTGFRNYEKNFISMVKKNGGFEGNSGNEGYVSSVNGVINLSGAIGDTNFIQCDEVPLISVHETRDFIVPYKDGKAYGLASLQGSFLIHDRMLKMGNESHLLTFKTINHTGYFYFKKRKTIEDFITHHLANCLK